jgi:purine-binding chemotaxis protein CheW
MTDRSGRVTSASWLLCRAGARLCALPLAQVVETMRALPIEAVSDAPAFVAGLSLIRGSPVPVINATAIFGEAAATPQRLVVCDLGGRHVAIAVDEVPGLIDGGAAAPLPPLLREAASDAVQALRVLDGELLLLLDAARLVPEATTLAALIDPEVAA